MIESRLSGLARMRGLPIWMACIGTVASAMAAAPTSAPQQRGQILTKLEFEVVSIKPSPSFSAPMARMQYVAGSHMDNAQDVLRAVSMASLLQMAFRVPADQIHGPGWMADVDFDVDAKLPAGSSKDQVHEMLQAMLVDRFGMTFHHEERVQQVYLLTTAKGGPALKAYTGSPEERVYCNGGPGQGYNCKGMSMEELASFLTQWSRMPRMSGPMQGAFPDRPVIDKTGLTGEYDFRLGIGYPGAADFRGGGDVPEPSTMVPAAVALKALGLALEPSRAPFDHIVIDHIERTPTAN